MPAVQNDWTVEKAHALPEDGKRYEVLDGELHVTPSPTYGHQSAILNLSWRLDAHVKAHRLGWVQFSPSTARVDRHRKRLIYQDERVPEYWIVDLDARSVERWKPDGARAEVFAETLLWQPRPDLEPLRIDLPEFFREVLPAPT